MTWHQCGSFLPLFPDEPPTQCGLAAGHEGRHLTEAWGPAITWANNTTSVRSVA